MKTNAEPFFEYIRPVGDDIRFGLRVEFDSAPMDWEGASVDIAVDGPDGEELLRLSSEATDEVTLVAPDELVDEDSLNLIAVLPHELVTSALAIGDVATFQCRMTEADGVRTTLLKGRIRITEAALAEM